MSDNSTILSLPLIQASQAQKHVTHNEAIRRLDALVQPVVQDMDRTEPPASPNEGDRHIVAGPATGDWLGQDGDIAVRQDNAWAFLTPADGWRSHVTALAADVVHGNGTWALPPVQAGTVGVNAAADPSNRLAVSADATLLTHEGAGHQLKLNKAAAADTASLLFQTNWGGRAEIGTSGSEALSIKTSADGTAWNEAMHVAPDTGLVSFPSGVRAPGAIHLNGRWHCETDERWMTFNTDFGLSGRDLDQSSGTLAEPDLAWQHFGPILPAGTRLTGFLGTFRRSIAEITSFDMRLVFHHADWTLDWDSNAKTSRTILHAIDGAALGAGWTRETTPMTPFTTPDDGFCLIYLRGRGAITSLRYIFAAMTLTYETAV